MTLGERLFAAAVATGAHPFHEAGLSWERCSDATKARWEACAVMVDAATRADVVSHGAEMVDAYQAAKRAEAGRS